MNPGSSPQAKEMADESMVRTLAAQAALLSDTARCRRLLATPPRTRRVDREIFARIWENWRDGYTGSLTEHGGISREEIEQRWREMIACVRDPRGYALWQMPVWMAAKPVSV